jgi:hypothetical protein
MGEAINDRRSLQRLMDQWLELRRRKRRPPPLCGLGIVGKLSPGAPYARVRLNSAPQRSFSEPELQSKLAIQPA